jgi:hypothetical protein
MNRQTHERIMKGESEGVPVAEWRAAALNRLFREQGTGISFH